MDLTLLFVTQRKLYRSWQIPGLVRAIQNGDYVPPIRLGECEDGTIQVENGHHRAAAYWLSGRAELQTGEYVLFFRDQPRNCFGRISDMLRREGLAEDRLPDNDSGRGREKQAC